MDLFTHIPNYKQGFARVNKWKLESTYDEAAAAGAKYVLDWSHVTHGMGTNNPWSIEQAERDGTKCLLTYEVRITGTEMTNTLLVENTGTSAFDFAALLHTYYAVDNGAAQDNTKVYVDGLGGYTISDQVGELLWLTGRCVETKSKNAFYLTMMLPFAIARDINKINNNAGHRQQRSRPIIRRTRCH